MNDTRRLWKTTKYYRRAREYIRELNNIFRQLEVLVCSLKKFGV